MSEQVKVEDFEVFREFRGAMVKFAHIAAQALSNADGQIARVHSWLENEQATFWQSQLRKRMEAATAARDAVRQKKLYRDFSGRTPSAIEEEKKLARCLAAVEQAEQKIEIVRKSLPRLEKAAEQYRGGVSQLGNTIGADIPKAVALLDRLVATLEEYVQIEAPAAAAESAAISEAPESFARSGEAAEPPPPLRNDKPPAATTDGPAAPPAPPAPDGPVKEAPHVSR